MLWDIFVKATAMMILAVLLFVAMTGWNWIKSRIDKPKE